MARQQVSAAAKAFASPDCHLTALLPSSVIPITILSSLCLLLFACGEGPITSLDHNRHQVAAQCGRAIADALPTYRPVILKSPDGAVVNPHSLVIEIARFGPALALSPRPPAPTPELAPELAPEQEKAFILSDRCLAVARRGDLLLTALRPSGSSSPNTNIGATVRGTSTASGDHQGQPRGVSQVGLQPLRTSPADFRRCGHPPQSYAVSPIIESKESKESINALVVWPYNASRAKAPPLKGLSFWLDALHPRHDAPIAPASATRGRGQQLFANERGCLFYPKSLGARRLKVDKEGMLVATRPLRVTRPELPPLPLILCPRAKSGQLQLALPGEPCQSGFVSYCQLALKDQLRRPLGSWLQLLSARLNTKDCAVIQNSLNDGMTIPISGHPTVAADLEALRYDMPRLTALTVAASIAYLPAIEALESLTILQKEGQSTADTFSEPQPRMTRLTLRGGSVKLSQLPLAQLSGLTLDGVGLTQLVGIARGQNLSFLDLSHNAIADLTILPHLPKLAQLRLTANPVTDLSPLLAMPELRELDVAENPRLDIDVLRQLTQLESLGLAENSLEDLSWLRELTQLLRLNLSHNELRDLSPLKVLKRLTAVDADGNGLVDISPIAALGRLQRLTLNNNLIRSVAPLRQLELLTTFELDSNPLGRGVKKTTDNCPVDAASMAIRAFCLR